MMRVALSFVLASCFSLAVAAQSPSQSAARSASDGPAPASGPAASATQSPVPPNAQPAAQPNAAPVAEAYAYDPAGRRDPFVSLVGTGTEPPSEVRKGGGVAGLSVTELAVRGVMQSRGSLVAMVQGPDNKTFIVHQGDKLFDGQIKSINPQGLVIIQQVNDPLSSVKQREVRKFLRAQEEAKQ
jgi:Tfp pilus assembly protein PilP